ncbi:hypothetical protein YSA_08932 [Pseudomonas putida ND6]|uniref:Uncharacterized protein n=1 Tax=Pseudomonas putida ND6 TaxID=231023 RepID=I3V1H5_PSEPU|nr:hypothetical protein YSA_08932 [Pseudomonas putida ND6]
MMPTAIMRPRYKSKHTLETRRIEPSIKVIRQHFNNS